MNLYVTNVLYFQMQLVMNCSFMNAVCYEQVCFLTGIVSDKVCHCAISRRYACS